MMMLRMAKCCLFLYFCYSFYSSPVAFPFSSTVFSMVFSVSKECLMGMKYFSNKDNVDVEKAKRETGSLVSSDDNNGGDGDMAR